MVKNLSCKIKTFKINKFRRPKFCFISDVLEKVKKSKSRVKVKQLLESSLKNLKIHRWFETFLVVVLQQHCRRGLPMYTRYSLIQVERSELASFSTIHVPGEFDADFHECGWFRGQRVTESGRLEK